MDCTLSPSAIELVPSVFPIVVASPPRPSWSALCAIEPRLAIVEANARRLRRSPNRWAVYESLKRRLNALVGWGATDSRLATSDAYEVAIAAVLSAIEGDRR